MKNFKMKINTNRKPMSSQEIGNMQDFGSVLKGAEATALPFYKKWWFMGGVGIAIIVSIVAAALTFNNNYSMPNTQVAATPTPLNPNSSTPQVTDLEKASETEQGISSFWVESGKAKSFITNNGTTIKVPNSHFVYSNGKKVYGNVEIKYCEMNDYKVAPTSGTSKSYNNNTVSTEVNSALTEMQGLHYWKNGQQVYTNPKFPILISTKASQTDDYLALNKIEYVKEKQPSVTKVITSNTVSKADLLETTGNKAPQKAISQKVAKKLEQVKTNDSIITEGEAVSKNNKPQKPSFNISYPIDPNDSLFKALEKVVKEIKQLEAQEFKKPIRMEKAKQNFTMKFDSNAHPELALFSEVTFGVADEKIFTPALFKYKWQVAIVSENNNTDNSESDVTIGNSYMLQLNNATYIGEELFKINTKITKEKSWLARLWSNFKGIFTKTKKDTTPKKQKTIIDEVDVQSAEVDKTVRIVPLDSSQYYYQRSDYRSPVRFEVYPVLTDEQYANAISKYETKLKQHKKLLQKKLQKESEIREAIKKRREERISAQRRKIEIYMGLSKDTGLH